MKNGKHRVCPVQLAGSLDNGIRRWFQNPRKILAPYIKEGMTVMDLGCGPGFFSVDMAGMVGGSGLVIAVDLQDAMLQKVRGKIQGTEFEQRIMLHKCETNKIGVSRKIDFVLAFYVVHEVSDKEEFFGEIASIINPGGKVLMVEPLFHVSKGSFENTVNKAKAAGFIPVGSPGVFLSRAVILQAA